MRRIKPNRCGYLEYTCFGIPNLTDAYATISLVSDNVRNRIDNFYISNGSNYIDNYYNLPIQFKGFVTSVDSIPNMYKSDLPYPECSCINNTNPFVSNGFLNLVKEFYPSESYYTNIKETAESLYSMDVARLSTVGASYLNSNDIASRYVEALSDFKENGIDSTLGPGIAEPMLEVGFPTVSIKVNTTDDAFSDGLVFVVASFSKWKNLVDTKLKELGSYNKKVKGMENLVNEQQMQSICDQFKIELTEGNPLIVGSSTDVSPTYRISGGTAYVNGYAIEVLGVDNIQAPFNAYIKFYIDDTTKELKGIIELTDTREDFNSYIGGVHKIVSEKTSESEKYILYQIEQKTCYIDIDMVRTEDGFIYRDTANEQSVPGMPFTSFGFKTCD